MGMWDSAVIKSIVQERLANQSDGKWSEIWQKLISLHWGPIGSLFLLESWSDDHRCNPCTIRFLNTDCVSHFCFSFAHNIHLICVCFPFIFTFKIPNFVPLPDHEKGQVDYSSCTWAIHVQLPQDFPKTIRLSGPEASWNPAKVTIINTMFSWIFPKSSYYLQMSSLLCESSKKYSD